MINHYDTIVVGVGSMGSAACYELAKRGKKVLGIEQFTTPNENGSHTGQSRIIRKAYFEHPDYVPLLERAYENWQSLEEKSDTQLYHRTGILYMGKPDHENIAGVRNSASIHNIAIRDRDHEELRKQTPVFNIPSDFDIIFEPDAGFVTPERTIETYVREAEKLGATVLRNTAVLKWNREGDSIRVTTSSADFTADTIVFTAGAWTSRLLPRLNIDLRVTRQLLAWISPSDPSSFALGNFPCWFVEDPSFGTFYGFPILHVSNGPIGLKLAHHHPGSICRPGEQVGPASQEELDKLRYFLRTYLPSAGEQVVHTKHCLYTYSADTHFVIDHHPDFNKRVVVACGFSGHGFKFVPVVGEALADLATDGRTDLPIEFLRIRRFGG